MLFTMCFYIYMKWNPDYSIFVWYIQYFLDSLEFQENQENIHPNFTILKVVLSLPLTHWYKARTLWNGIRTIAPRLGLGFGSRLGLVLGLGGYQTIAPWGNCTPVRITVWVRVSFGVVEQFSLGAIVLEPCETSMMQLFCLYK